MNTRRQMLTACLAALPWPRLLQARPDTALVIQDGSLFDPASMKLMPIQAVVITGEKITAVGTPQKPVPLPTGARVIDAKGKFIRRYLPELARLPDAALHAPWDAKPMELMAAGVALGMACGRELRSARPTSPSAR